MPEGCNWFSWIVVSVAADSSNAAEVAQAAIMQSQQKKLKHGNQPAVLSAAPVLHHPAHAAMATASAPEYMQYRELVMLFQSSHCTFKSFHSGTSVDLMCITSNSNLVNPLPATVATSLTLCRPLLPYEYNCKASCARPSFVILTFRHSDAQC